MVIRTIITIEVVCIIIMVLIEVVIDATTIVIINMAVVALVIMDWSVVIIDPLVVVVNDGVINEQLEEVTISLTIYLMEVFVTYHVVTS